jgi:hypothetical protein
MLRRTSIFVALALSLLTLPAVTAAESERSDDRSDRTGVKLYEISERVTFDPQSLDGKFVVFRNAISPLLGFAPLGTPLCPSVLLSTVPHMESCTVIATGTDSVSTVTGLGPVHGTFDVVINAPGNSAIHIPDLPVISGTFTGMNDLSPAVRFGVPLGSITGTFKITQMADASGMLHLVPPVTLAFTGTFRLPFALDRDGWPKKRHHGHAAFYLADDLRTLIPIRPGERSISFPAVRLEVSFGQ